MTLSVAPVEKCSTSESSVKLPVAKLSAGVERLGPLVKQGRSGPVFGELLSAPRLQGPAKESLMLRLSCGSGVVYLSKVLELSKGTVTGPLRFKTQFKEFEVLSGSSLPW